VATTKLFCGLSGKRAERPGASLSYAWQPAAALQPLVVTASDGRSGQEENMTIPTGVDTDAPVRAHHEIDINAPLETV
jgi:hypothetical protein